MLKNKTNVLKDPMKAPRQRLNILALRFKTIEVVSNSKKSKKKFKNKIAST